MKKIYGIIIVAVLASLLASCSKNNEIREKTGGVVFHASAADTKVHAEGLTTYWNEGEKVWIGNVEFTSVQSGKSVTLQANMEPDLFGDSYYSVIPQGSFEWGGSTAQTSFSLIWPTTVTYSSVPPELPMCAKSQDRSLMFHHLGSLVHIVLPQSNGVRVKSISITTPTIGEGEGARKQYLAGRGNIDFDNVTAAISGNGASGTITLDCSSSPVSLDSQKEFFIVVPPSPYSDGKYLDVKFCIIATGSTGDWTCTRTLGEMVARRGQRVNVSFNSVGPDPEYVELYGVKWATRNIGALNPWETGTYVQWGATSTPSGGDYSFQTLPYAQVTPSEETEGAIEVTYTKYTVPNGHLESCDDAATVNVGNAWRSPTFQEVLYFKNGRKDNGFNLPGGIIKKYTLNGIDGFLLSDTEDKLKRESLKECIFLPLSGYKNGTSVDSPKHAFIWTNELSEDIDEGFVLAILASESESDEEIIEIPNRLAKERRYGLPVRPVYIGN